jgi:ZIP family zinc transporter
MNPVLLGTLGALAAGMMTTVGAIPVLIGKYPSERTRDGLLGFAAGVMLAASFFSLIVPALDIATERYGDGAIPAAIAAIGILLGGAAIAVLDRILPHEHFLQGREGPQTAALRRIWLFIIAITIHNFPEGLAVGVGFAGSSHANATSLAIGIGLQNLPEGMAVGVALLGEGYNKYRAFFIAALTGMVEPIGGFLGAIAVTISAPLLPWGLVFAAGAMLYVISHEIIPETHRRGFQNVATTGLMIGLVIMLFLDVWLA